MTRRLLASSCFVFLTPGVLLLGLGYEQPPAEPGFVPLFDGKDIAQHFVIKGNPESWKVADGAKSWLQHWRLDDFNEIRARVRSNPPVIDVWLNGTHLSQFKDSEKRLDDKGRLGLQVHGGKGWPAGAKVRFRNIQVRELPR